MIRGKVETYKTAVPGERVHRGEVRVSGETLTAADVLAGHLPDVAPGHERVTVRFDVSPGGGAVAFEFHDRRPA
jgi:hypothetical protein